MSETQKRENQIVQTYKNMGYNFESLTSYCYMRERHTLELEKRLKLIAKMDGKCCICSAFGDSKDGESTVPLAYCVIKDGDARHLCPYFGDKRTKIVKEIIKKAIELHKEIKSEEEK